MAYSIGKKVSDLLVKVDVNDFGDSIMINPGDATFPYKFNELAKWIEAQEAELGEKAKHYEEIYKDKPMISVDADGNVTADIEQVGIIEQIQIDLYTEVVKKIDDLFGDGTMHKYFRALYEYNPNFIPDDDCIADFFEEITPVLDKIFDSRLAQVKSRYNKNRKGSKK